MTETKRKWTAEERRQLAAGEIEGGFAGPDQSFPIASAADVADAWGLAGHADDPDAIRRKIISIARKYGWLSGLPASAREWAADNGINLGKTLGKTLGDALKAIGTTDDKRWLIVENHIVLFGNENTKDLVGEWFDEETELESDYTKSIGRLAIDFEHGLRVDGDDAPGRDDILGYTDWTTAKKTDSGWLVQSMLDRRNKYVEMFEPLIAERMIGTSSEAAAESVVVEDTGRIRSWPLIRNSLTVEPCEPGMLSGNALTAYKSLQSLLQPEVNVVLEAAQETAADEAKVDNDNFTEEDTIIVTYGDVKMSEEQQDKIKSLEDDVSLLTDQIDQLLQVMANSPAAKGAVIAPDSETDHANVKSFGDFLYAVQMGNHKRITQVYKTGYDQNAFKDMSGNVGIYGGVLVPEEYVQDLLMVAGQESEIMRRVRRIQVRGEAGAYPALDQYVTPTAGIGNTALAAAANLATVEAGGTYAEATPQFTQIQYRLNKLGAVVDVEEELVSDSPFAIETLLRQIFAISLAGKNERNVIRGSGVGEPLGILNWAGCVNVDATTDNSFLLANAVNMLSKFKAFTNNVVWICHPGILPDIYTMETSAGGQAFLGPGLNTGPSGTLFGYPIVLSEQSPAANTDTPILADLGAYLFFEKQNGLAVAYSEHVNFKTGMGCWRFSHRNDGKPWLVNKITLADPTGSYYVSPFVYFND